MHATTHPTVFPSQNGPGGPGVKGQREEGGDVGQAKKGVEGCMCVTCRNILQMWGLRPRSLGGISDSGGQTDRAIPLSARDRKRRALTYLEVLLHGYISDWHCKLLARSTADKLSTAELPSEWVSLVLFFFAVRFLFVPPSLAKIIISVTLKTRILPSPSFCARVCFLYCVMSVSHFFWRGLIHIPTQTHLCCFINILASESREAFPSFSFVLLAVIPASAAASIR